MPVGKHGAREHVSLFLGLRLQQTDFSPVQNLSFQRNLSWLQVKILIRFKCKPHELMKALSKSFHMVPSVENPSLEVLALGQQV